MPLRKRPHMEWKGTALISSAIAAGGSLVTVVVGNADMDQFTRPTLMRLRGSWGVNVEAVGVGMAFCGVCLYPNRSVASPPLPGADFDFPWLWQQGMFIDANAGAFATSLNIDIIDSKARRRVVEDEVLLCILTGGGLATKQGFNLRALFSQG